jgi:hypothetical protein
VFCDEHGIGGDGEYCGDDDAQLDRINVFYRMVLSSEFTTKAAKKLELIQTQLAQKPMLRAEVYACALRASQNVKRAEVWAATLRGGGDRRIGAPGR